jgi:hypothetical protein
MARRTFACSSLERVTGGGRREVGRAPVRGRAFFNQLLRPFFYVCVLSLLCPKKAHVPRGAL